MTDQELRELLQQAHSDDHPPPFGLPHPAARARARARRVWQLLAAAALVAAALVIWSRVKPRPEVSLAALEVRIHYPLDFLLDVPGADLLRTTPSFDAKETWP